MLSSFPKVVITYFIANKMSLGAKLGQIADGQKIR